MNQNRIEDYNIASDVRSRDAVKPPVLHYEGCTECGEVEVECACGDFQATELETELPMKWAVCHVCNGKGRHVNPAIDAGGLSAEMQDDPEFLEQYAEGVYDQPCNGCKGRTTVPVVDWDALTQTQRKLYENQLRDDADYEAERLAEIRMGC